MTLQPLGDKVIIERLSAEQKTKGGIIVPDSAQEKPQEGKVIAVGKGKVLKNGKVAAPAVKSGDKILFGKYTGNEVKVDDKEYLIIEADDILAIIN